MPPRLPVDYRRKTKRERASIFSPPALTAFLSILSLISLSVLSESVGQHRRRYYAPILGSRLLFHDIYLFSLQPHFQYSSTAGLVCI
jgi:hypothetical protein